MRGENSVELTGHYGGDLNHALSAWTSTSRELTPEKVARVPALLKMLAGATPPHTSPFEKSAIQFLVRVDTASHIHLLKHRIAVSVNGESARYRQLRSLTFYEPNDWDEEETAIARSVYEYAEEAYADLMRRLEPRLGRRRAKESARYVLPYGNQLTLDVMFNFKSFVHFLSLRRHEDAQREIDDVATRMLDLVRETGDFDASLAAWGY